jgi:hypothetical protein
MAADKHDQKRIFIRELIEAHGLAGYNIGQLKVRSRSAEGSHR